MVIDVLFFLSLLFIFSYPFVGILYFNGFSKIESLILGIGISLGIIPSFVWLIGNLVSLTLAIVITFIICWLSFLIYYLVKKYG